MKMLSIFRYHCTPGEVFCDHWTIQVLRKSQGNVTSLSSAFSKFSTVHLTAGLTDRLERCLACARMKRSGMAHKTGNAEDCPVEAIVRLETFTIQLNPPEMGKPLNSHDISKPQRQRKMNMGNFLSGTET